MHLNIFGYPCRITILTTLAHLAGVTQIIGYLKNDVMELQMLLPLVCNRIISNNGTNNITGNSTCRITVSLVVYRYRNSLVEIILISQRITDCTADEAPADLIQPVLVLPNLSHNLFPFLCILRNIGISPIHRFVQSAPLITSHHRLVSS